MIARQSTIQPFTNISYQIKVIELRKEDPKQNSSIKREEGKIHSFTGMAKEPSKTFLMQILPVKVKSIDRRTTATYALHMCYVNDSQSTL